MNPYEQFFQDLPNLRAVVVGDLMLDTYYFGQVDRLSPEAPVPVVTHQHQEDRIGGAGNVALNLQSLGAQVELFSIVGDDVAADILRDLLNTAGINGSSLLVDETRPTTRKTRVLDRNKQLLRLDQESTQDLLIEQEKAFIRQLLDRLASIQPGLLIFEDYNKGFLTESLITQLIKHCKERGIVTAVDPKKKNFFTYQGVDLFKPNWREVSEALSFIAEPDIARLTSAHNSLQDKLNHRTSLITLSEKGVFYQEDSSFEWLPCHPRKIADVSGAGDTVIAVAATAYALTKNPACMSNLANLAGGLVCEQVGTTPVQFEELRSEAERLGWL
jgi:rfaE bifunctional protein kinase chain/domain